MTAGRSATNVSHPGIIEHTATVLRSVPIRNEIFTGNKLMVNKKLQYRIYANITSKGNISKCFKEHRCRLFF